MNWNVVLETHNAACFTGHFQAAKPILCLRWPQIAKIAPKLLPVAASSQLHPAAIPSIRIAEFQKTRAPLTHADAVSLKST
jgi:hypothetical protein